MLLALAVIAALVAGCGGGSSSSSSGSSGEGSSGEEGSSAGGGAETTAAESGGEPIELLLDAPTENPIFAFPAIQEAAEAAAKAINAEGGAGGHEIEIVYCNNLADVNKSKECARQAIEEDVAAVVGHIDIWSNESLPILEKGGVPDIGFWSNGLPEDFTSEISFPLQSGTVANYVALAYAAKEAGKKKIGVATTNIPSAIQNAKTIEYAAKKVGIDYVGTVEIPATGVTDYSSYAQELKEMGPEAVATIISIGPQIGLLKAAKSIGLDVQWLNIAQAAGEKEAKEAEGLDEGAILSSPFPSVRDESSELVSQFNEEMKKEESIDPVQAGASTQQAWAVQMNAWLSVHAVAALAAGIEGELDAASLKEAAEAAKGLTLVGGYEWSPGEEGPPDYPNVTNWDQYLLQFKDGGKLETLPGEPVDVESSLPPTS